MSFLDIEQTHGIGVKKWVIFIFQKTSSIFFSLNTCIALGKLFNLNLGSLIYKMREITVIMIIPLLFGKYRVAVQQICFFYLSHTYKSNLEESG